MTKERKEWEQQKYQYKKTHTPQCKRCMFFAPWGQGMAIHHIKPLADGGDNSEENLIVLCNFCHHEWHLNYEDSMPFKDWLNSIPLHLIGALMNRHDKFGKLDITIDDISKGWPWIKDHLMVTQPYKDDQCKKYVEKNSSNWIDW